MQSAVPTLSRPSDFTIDNNSYISLHTTQKSHKAATWKVRIQMLEDPPLWLHLCPLPEPFGLHEVATMLTIH